MEVVEYQILQAQIFGGHRTPHISNSAEPFIIKVDQYKPQELGSGIAGIRRQDYRYYYNHASYYGHIIIEILIPIMAPSRVPVMDGNMLTWLFDMIIILPVVFVMLTIRLT